MGLHMYAFKLCASGVHSLAFGPIEQISNWIERYLSNRISNRISCEDDFQGQILFKMANHNFIRSLEFLYTLLSLHAKRLNVMFMNEW